MPVLRGLAFLLLVLMAAVLQVSFFGFFSYEGVVPNLVLLVVVAAGLTRGPETAAFLGFVGGLAIDLAPPSDHIAGRWALALVIVGCIAGRVRRDSARSSLVALATVAVCSVVGTSIFALSGMLLDDGGATAGEALKVILAALLYDLLLAPFVLPLAMRVFTRLQPPQVAY